MGLQGVTGGYRGTTNRLQGLQGVARVYKEGLQRGYRGLHGVTTSYRVFYRDHRLQWS